MIKQRTSRKIPPAERISRSRQSRRSAPVALAQVVQPVQPAVHAAEVSSSLPSHIGRIHAVLHVVRALPAQTYLEIGCRDDECFGRVREVVPSSVGLDPVMGGTLRTTSDEFFATDARKFDVIFIDGDHRHPQVLRDIENSLDHLADGGVIVMHDVWPFNPQMEHASLSGTVWRAFVRGARTRPDVEAFAAVLPQDPVGVGIMRKMPNTRLVTEDIDMERLQYHHMLEHEHDWMRRISFEDACRRLGLPPP